MGDVATSDVRALIDTWGLLALGNARDQHHAQAVEITLRHRTEGGTFIGTTLVLSEFHSHMLYLRDPIVARTALRHLMEDPIHQWIEVGPALVGEARSNWLVGYEDQPFRLVDAVSLEVMRREKATAAFAFDHRYEVAGFELLRA